MDLSNISSLTDYYTSVTGQTQATELANSLSSKAENASNDEELLAIHFIINGYPGDQIETEVLKNSIKSKM